MSEVDKNKWDVIVMGGGGSGLAAAIEAARRQAKVLVLEKGNRPGGTTSCWSVGSFTSSQTPHQRRAGIEDSPETHFEDLGKFNAGKNATDNLALRRLLCEHSPETFQWLLDLGVEFVGPNPEPPHRVARMHNVVPSSASFAFHLMRECRRLGVEVRCGWRVIDLLWDGHTASGVRAISPAGVNVSFRCERGVILAAGDFSANRTLKTEFLAPQVVSAVPINELSTGDGLEIARKNGGTILNGGHCNAPRMRFIPAPKNIFQSIPPSRGIARMMGAGWRILPSWLMRPFLMKFITTALGPEPTLFKCGAILVDPQGNRVEVDLNSTARHLALTEDNRGYIVFGSKCAEQLRSWPNFVSTAPGVAYAYLDDYRRSRPDVYAQAETIHGLAGHIGAVPDKLANALASTPGQDKGPFYALGPVRAYVLITEGGLAVNEQLQVLGANDVAIPGLFAAGSNGQGGMLLEGHGHHVGWAFVSGRLAGRNVLSFTDAVA